MASGTQNTIPKSRIQSFQMSEATFKRFMARLPKYGERSKILNRLVEMFLDGEVIVNTKVRQF